MPSNWLSIDSNFPSFTGEESPGEQIRALHNYLFQLREGLQYSLQNLTADNFNATALQDMTDAQKNEVATELKKVYNLLNQMSAEVDSLSGRVSGNESLAGRVTAAEEGISYLERRMTQSEARTSDIEEAVSVIEESMASIDGRVRAMEEELPQMEQAVADLQEITGTVQVAEDGSATIGSEGKPLRLVGHIYINGVLYEQGGTT